MSLNREVLEIARQARETSRVLANLPPAAKTGALTGMAQALPPVRPALEEGQRPRCGRGPPERSGGGPDRAPDPHGQSHLRHGRKPAAGRPAAGPGGRGDQDVAPAQRAFGRADADSVGGDRGRSTRPGPTSLPTRRGCASRRGTPSSCGAGPRQFIQTGRSRLQEASGSGNSTGGGTGDPPGRAGGRRGDAHPG